MGNRKRFLRRGEELTLTITDIAFGGKGIAKIQNDEGEFTVFVPNSITGQVVKAKVIKSKKNYAECKLMNVITPSPQEVDVDFQMIPGAPFMKLPIEEQREFKERTCFDLFERIGKVADVREKFDEYIESPEIWHYRNKMEYSFSAIGYDLKTNTDVDEFSLGFKHRGTWWMVENLDSDSGMFDRQLESSMKDIREYLIKTGLPAWHPPKKEGFYRYFVVRKSFYSDQLLINLVTSDSGIDKFDKERFIDLLKGILGERLAGVILTINNQIGDRVEPTAGNTTLLYGDSKIVEDINGLKFEISISSFFQTNPKCAEKLYNKVLEYVGEIQSEKEYVLDLFCGTGTIAQLLTRGTDKPVVGVDIVESAIADAKENAKRNNIDQIEFHAADVNKFLVDYPEYKNNIATIVLDPPRAGISPKALARVIELGAETIVYVSCNPATQARDAEQLIQAGYSLEKISFVDQFPHTGHVETVALFGM